MLAFWPLEELDELAAVPTGCGEVARGGCLFAWNFSVTRSFVLSGWRSEGLGHTWRCRCISDQFLAYCLNISRLKNHVLHYIWPDNTELTAFLLLTEEQKSVTTSRKQITVFGAQIWLQLLFLSPDVPPLAEEGCPLSTPPVLSRTTFAVTNNFGFDAVSLGISYPAVDYRWFECIFRVHSTTLPLFDLSCFSNYYFLVELHYVRLVL